MISEFKKYFVFLISCSVFFISCTKKLSSVNGSNSVVYESKKYLDLNSNYEAVVHKSSIPVENVMIYYDMLGNIISNAQKATINNNKTEIRDIKITNAKVTFIKFTNVQNIDSLEKYLVNGTIYLKYFSTSGVYQEKKIGSFPTIDKQKKEVNFDASSDDLTSFIENNPDNLYFDIQLKGKPNSPLLLKYYVGFDYEYSYQQREIK